MSGNQMPTVFLTYLIQTTASASSKPATSAAPPGMVTAGTRQFLPGASTAKTTQVNDTFGTGIQMVKKPFCQKPFKNWA